MPGDADGDYWLDLGEVCLAADVSINGQNLGLIKTAFCRKIRESGYKLNLAVLDQKGIIRNQLTTRVPCQMCRRPPRPDRNKL